MKQITLKCLNLCSWDFQPLDQCSISSLPCLQCLKPCCVCSDLWSSFTLPHVLLFSQSLFIDQCLSTLTVPKMASDLYSGHKSISFQGCVIQIFILHVLSGSQMVLVITMALDQYVAICKPLHYLTVMSPQMCILLLSGVWSIGLIHCAVQLAFVVHLHFCGPNEINSCRFPQFIKFAYIDTCSMRFMVTANDSFISTGTFFLMIISYIFILVTVWTCSSGGLSKVLYTLSTHITVVVLSLDHTSLFTCGHIPQCQWINFLPFWTLWFYPSSILTSIHWGTRLWRWQWGNCDAFCKHYCKHKCLKYYTILRQFIVISSTAQKTLVYSMLMTNNLIIDLIIYL